MTLAHEVSASGGLRVLEEESEGLVRSPTAEEKSQTHTSQLSDDSHDSTITKNTTDNSDIHGRLASALRAAEDPCTNESPVQSDSSAVLLATANAVLLSDYSQLPVRLLIDSESELTFISSSVVKTCHLQRRPSGISVLGIGNEPAVQTRGVTTVTLRSTHTQEQVTINAHILKCVTGTLPTRQLKELNWSALNSLQLADPDYSTPRPIDILIGADCYGLIVKAGIKQFPQSSLIAQDSIFGWMLIGSPHPTRCSSQRTHHAARVNSYQQVSDLLTKFWVQEEVPDTSASQLSPDDQSCEDHYVTTHSRDHDGRYIVRIPLKASPSLLGNSSARAHQCLLHIIRRLTKNDSYAQLYHNFMQEYESLNHMTRAKASPVNSPVYYLPHHGVLREDSVTTKLRVVFNGSSPSSSGLSVNDIQHTGAKVQKDIADVLIWIRQHKFVFTSDITKMYRQIKVHQDDWDLQRILWVDEHSKIIPYQLTTVTYGTRSAPFLAVRTMIQLVKDEGHKFPLAVDPLLKGRYVDDIFGGADTVSQLIDISTQVRQLCMAGGFPLAKWHSNSLQFLQSLTDNSSEKQIHSFESSKTKLLGLSWIPATDLFKFNSKPPREKSKLTKRIILSETAQLYDPLGFLAPFIVRAKMLLQEIWLDKLSWDDQAPDHIITKWNSFRSELSQVSDLSIPRWLRITQKSTVELHGFSDASQAAMAAVVYIRTTHPDHGTCSTIVCSKSKVAPLKKMSIPRLELTAALLLARLITYVRNNLDIQPTQLVCWTDSSVTLTWIQSHSSRWKEFVRNRVSAIQDLTPIGVWRFVPGKQNPADCASRGISISQLRKHPLWWTGPQWLTADESLWPTQSSVYDSKAQQEERPGLTLVTQTIQHDYHWDMIYRHSRLIKLLRVTAICFRFSQLLRRVPQSSLTFPLTPQELERARIFWIKATQESYFSQEIKQINSNSLPVSHPLARLTAFIDTQGVIRVGGRLANASLDQEAKHPAILPQKTHLSRLIIADAHERTLHGGTQATLNLIRSSYWIIGGRLLVRSYIYHCMKCARLRGERAKQLMGRLPLSRITPARPFAVCGVDYAGPITLKTWKGRGAKTSKAFRRFTGRRGVCRTLHSDCGTTFQGADTLIRQLFMQGTQQFSQLAAVFAKDGTDWKFNLPAAPHMGGKWEAAVKSVKFHLNRTIGDSLFTYEELSTLLVQIEAVLNSRPLEPLSADSTDISALTPAHFLVGEPLVTLPEPSLEDVPMPSLSRWQFIQQRLQSFWSKWSKQYLQQQLAISKWKHPFHNITVGSLVLLTDERFPPTKWPLARVIEVFPGSDGLIRTVKLRTATAELVRPLTKLVILPYTPPAKDQQRRC
ncbi:uncharacterized protein [Chelonus insularis]|uniref:uncharacterized protein n=1 Tax=Chelonus insularis TaxID=460826 RepID=UPI00158E10B3|nr:uncharacterized protein LOC118070451 [Chelonus insularis]